MVFLEPMTPLERRIAERIVVEDHDGWDCWIWQGRKTHNGYARFSFASRDQGVYNLMYEILIGPIPEGLELDHLCKRPACVNPFHCEPVTHRENLMRGNGPTAVNARKTHCIHGHRLTAENLLPDSRGKRECRACNLKRANEYYKRRVAKQQIPC